jgi:hypothetical protein
MTMTPFFLELHAAYQSELDDLATDSEGRDVLQQRLREKRREIGFLAQMMELSPEMVAVVFHRGFQFREPAVMEQLLTLEADEFPDWDDVLVSVQLHPWAQDLAATVRKQPAGEWFLTVAAACWNTCRAAAWRFRPGPTRPLIRTRPTAKALLAPSVTTRSVTATRTMPRPTASAKRPAPTGWPSRVSTARNEPPGSRFTFRPTDMNQIALIEKTRSLIAAGDISGAEAALADLADTEGDGALMVVLEQLQPKDILAVIREYDNSKDSVINLLVTPAQFARAVVIEKQYKDLTRTHLRGMMNAVIFREDADPIEFLTAIGDLEGGSEALADYFSEKWSRIEAFARTGLFDTVEDDGEIVSEATLRGATYARARIERDEVADQDWMELAWILRYELPDLFIEMLLVLRAKARAHDLGLDDEDAEEDDGKVDLADTDRGRATPVAQDPDEESAI